MDFKTDAYYNDQVLLESKSDYDSMVEIFEDEGDDMEFFEEPKEYPCFVKVIFNGVGSETSYFYNRPFKK